MMLATAYDDKDSLELLNEWSESLTILMSKYLVVKKEFL
jgi:hypothetical protein